MLDILVPHFKAGLELGLLLLALVSPAALAQTAVETPRTIRVVVDKAYAPYSFQSDDGKLQGILIDQWQAWEKKTGIKVEIHALDWGEALRRMRAGEFDVIDCIVETAERRAYFDFTPAYATIEASIFFRNDISGIADLASLKGFPVGVKAGDQHIDRLKENGVTTVIPFQNNDEIIEAAKQHKISVFVVDGPSALYLLNKAGIEGDFRQSAPVFRDEIRRAMRKGDAALLRTVSEGFAAIEPGVLKQIDEKWFGRTINRIRRYLTYSGYVVAVAILVIAGLTVWNRTLKKRVLQRTAALAESEHRFRRLVEVMPVAVYVCDTSGIIQSYNNRAVELWGREPKSGDTAQRYCGSLRLYSPDGKLVPHEESKMAEALRTGVPAHDLEVVIERPDGSCITALVNIAPLRNGQGELIGAINCFQDITERKRAEVERERLHKQVEQAKDRLQILARRLVDAQETERRRVAQELHDEVGHALTVLNLTLSECLRLSPAVPTEPLSKALQTLDELADRVRNVSLKLRPSMLDDLGLLPALVWQCEAFRQQTGIQVDFSHAGLEGRRFAPEIETAAYRIGQEALTNVARHAGVPAAKVKVWVEAATLHVQVEDRGRGFDAESAQTGPDRIGLSGMRARAEAVGGNVNIESTTGTGTCIHAELRIVEQT